MSKSKLRTRRVRRQQKASLKNWKAKPIHKLKAGRTGRVHEKKLRSRRRKKKS